MGRRAVLGPLLLLVAIGCRASGRPEASPQQARWERLSARLCPRHGDPAAAADIACVPPLERHAALARAARAGGQAVVHVAVRLAAPPAGADGGDGPRPAALESGGTGVVIGADGLILTNAHVVRGAADVCVVLPDGARWPVEQLVLDEGVDLAVLRIAARGLAVLSPQPVTAGVGAPVVALGRTVPAGPSVNRTGVVIDACASLQNELDSTRTCCYEQLIESTTALEPGFSGGPLLDAAGRLMGLNVAVAGPDDARRGYAVPFTDRVCRVVSRLARAATP